MLFRSIFGISLVACVLLTSVSSAPSARERFEAATRYWQWSSYWSIEDLDFPSASYRAGLSFGARVFFDKNLDDVYWGFCSRQIGICQVYSSWEDNTVYRARGIRMQGGESEEQALRRFQAQEFSSEDEATNPAGTVLVPPAPNQSAGNGARIDVPTLNSLGGDRYELQIQTETITLPILAMPEAVRKHKSNKVAEEEIIKLFGRPRAGSGCVMTIPFADEHSPEIPVLLDCKAQKTIQLIRRQFKEWTVTAGDFVDDQRIVQRLAPKILENSSRTLK